MGDSIWEKHFSNIANWRLLQKYDSYNCMLGIKLKSSTLSFIWWVFQWYWKMFTITFSWKTWLHGNSVTKCVKKMHNFVTYLQLLQYGIWKLFYDECRVKTCEMLPQSCRINCYSRSGICAWSNQSQFRDVIPLPKCVIPLPWPFSENLLSTSHVRSKVWTNYLIAKSTL